MSTLLETVPFVVDHLWTQDSPMFPLTVGGKTGPHIDQGGSELNVLFFSRFSRLSTFERVLHYIPFKCLYKALQVLL